MRLLKRIFILLLLISFKADAQTGIPNIGFEDGTFNHWDCYIGSIDPYGVISVSSSGPVYDRQTIIDKNSFPKIDYYGKFPTLCPNGSKYSLRLGNSDTSAQAERVTYTFTVPNVRSYSIIFNYAVVLENPNHAAFQQPKFTAQVYNITDGSYISCPSFNFIASSDLPGFRLSPVKGGKQESIYYKDWSTATIDLSNFSGKQIRLEFTTNDCTKRGHFGYAYLDINENSLSPISGNAYCAGQKSATLYAPNGFASYIWYNADLSKKVGEGQSLTISPPPPDKTTYALKILPYYGLGCIDTLYTTVNKIDEGFKLSVLDTIYGCPETGIDLTAPSITAGSSPGMTLSYFRDALATSYLYNPGKIDSSGVFYIQGINKEGCMNILPIQVIIENPEISVIDPTPVTFPTTVDLSQTFPHLKNITYSYYSNAYATVPVENYTAIVYGGIFYVKAKNQVGCITISPVNVVIHPPPPYTITAPNAFSPNNDGVNDNFNVTVKGQVAFGSVRIYNRYGKLVFATKSSDGYWDGNYNGQKLPTGTYYWLFEGTDEYYRTKIDKGGPIALLR